MPNHKNRSGFRFCNQCHVEFKLDEEHFHHDANRKHGFAYHCIACAKIGSKKNYKPRPSNWYNLTIAEKKFRIERTRSYARGYGFPTFKVSTYRHSDRKKGFSNDLDVPWFRENIASKPCFYCDDHTKQCGADRIDNTKGHLKNNIVPCCHDCNTSRMNRFSHSEMLILGRAIKQIKKMRLIHGQIGSA